MSRNPLGVFGSKKLVAAKPISRKAFELKVRHGEDITATDIANFDAPYLTDTKIEGLSFIQWAVQSRNANNVELLVRYTPGRVDIFQYFLSVAFNKAVSPADIRAMAHALVRGTTTHEMYPSLDDLDAEIDKYKDNPVKAFYLSKVQALKAAITEQLKEAPAVGAAGGRVGK